jgi:hypothetical protein
MNESLSAQLTELKQINSADFFARMGEKISPQIQSAFTTAMAPVTASINNAVDEFPIEPERRLGSHEGVQPDTPGRGWRRTS